MDAEKLPPRPPAGMKRYKAICRKPNQNPFAGRLGPTQEAQEVDLDETISFAQVEEWAREAAKRDGLEFLRLEVVTEFSSPSHLS